MYYDSGMYYVEWSETFGKNRWYHEDGTPRTYYPLDHNWKEIYDKVTRDADIYFNSKFVDDIDDFTSEFLAIVPTVWQKYKVQLEMLTGTLDGTNIDPDVFEAGFTRTTESNNANIFDSKNKGNVTNADETKLGQRTDFSTTGNLSDKESKQRNISMSQGVQAFDGMINNNNIGELGNDYADSLNDSILKEKDNSATDVNSTLGSQTNTTNGNVQSDSETTMNSDSKFTERVHETRVNYYDNLAFLRERMEQLGKIEPFHIAFKYLFRNVTSKCGWW